jgi:hypothetical protein
MLAKSNGFNGDRSANQEMMQRCIGLSEKGIEQGDAFCQPSCAELLVEATNQVSRAHD